MAVFQTLRNYFFVPLTDEEPETIVPAPATVYAIRPLTEKQMSEVLKLNLRCFKAGENYTKFTFSYLLNEPRTLSYRAVTPTEQMVAFIFVMADDDGTGHITTVGVAPEHRRRGLAVQLLHRAESAMRERGITTVMLEVRVSNTSAQDLYRANGYVVVQRLKSYYNNGEDGFLMVKSL